MRTPLRGLFASLIFFCLTPAYGLDLGDGTDGPCNWINNNNIAPGLYQCTDLIIDGTNTVASSATILDVRVQGTVTITGSLSLDAAGSARGAGGFHGGLGATSSNGNNGSGPTDANGNGGAFSTTFSAGEDCNGSGGSGASHSGVSFPVNGEDGDSSGTSCFPTIADGGAAPTESYGDPSNFRNSIQGGAGGGAGGSAESTVGGRDNQPGADGGGGGGVIRIYSGGDITIDSTSTISANGADGGNGIPTTVGNAHSGGGAGGAGGSIYLVSLSQIAIDTGALLEAKGGIGGTTPISGGNGSDGDFGYIRLEDSDGNIPGASAAATPSASVTTSVATSSTSSQLALESDISAGCALRKIYTPNFHIIMAAIFFGLWLALLKLTNSFKIDDASFERSRRTGFRSR